MQKIGPLVFDDDGFGMKDGSLALINGKHERIIHLEGDKVCIYDWPDGESILTVKRMDQEFAGHDRPEVI